MQHRWKSRVEQILTFPLKTIYLIMHDLYVEVWIRNDSCCVLRWSMNWPYGLSQSHLVWTPILYSYIQLHIEIDILELDSASSSEEREQSRYWREQQSNMKRMHCINSNWEWGRKRQMPSDICSEMGPEQRDKILARITTVEQIKYVCAIQDRTWPSLSRISYLSIKSIILK